MAANLGVVSIVGLGKKGWGGGGVEFGGGGGSPQKWGHPHPQTYGPEFDMVWLDVIMNVLYGLIIKTT